MKLLLTSSGITCDAIADALEDLSDKKFEEIRICFIPTAAFISAGEKTWLVNDLYRITSRGAKIDIVDIAQLTLPEILARLEACDVIFVGGGNPFYLSYWLHKSSLVDALPDLLKTRVYIGSSAGSMVATATLCTALDCLNGNIFNNHAAEQCGPVGKTSSETLKLVDFGFRPHMNSRYTSSVVGHKIQHLSNIMNISIYALDDMSALKIVDADVRVVGKGKYELIKPIS